MSRIVVATRSGDKLREVREILAPWPELELITLDQAAGPEIPDEAEIEQFATFQENAAAKALHFARRTGMVALADDSGLCVEALEGAPGVRSKRFASDHGLATLPSDDVNNAFLLERLAGVEPMRRGAAYVCAAAVATPNGVLGVETGQCMGTILNARMGTGGFGYDPLFHVPAEAATFAQLPPARKNQISHRVLALRSVVPLLLRTLR